MQNALFAATHRPSADYILANLATFPITVYYDHSCMLCRSEILHMKARDTRAALVLVDCSIATFDDSALPVSQAQLMDCIHAQDAQGRWLKATEVFIAIYREVGLNRVASAWRLGKPLAEKMYPWIVRNRHWLSKLGIHHMFNWMTARHLRQLADALLEQSRTCQDNRCER